MRNASAKVSPEALNQIGKKPWDEPRIQSIAITAHFDPSSGNTRAQWEAAMKLRASAGLTDRHPETKRLD